MYQKYKNTCAFNNGSHLEKSIVDYIIEQQNKNTRAKTTRDVKVLNEFLREKHEHRNPEDIEAKELNEYLCDFILSVNRKDGKDFEPSSLRSLFSSFNRHLKECNASVNSTCAQPPPPRLTPGD